MVKAFICKHERRDFCHPLPPPFGVETCDTSLSLAYTHSIQAYSAHTRAHTHIFSYSVTRTSRNIRARTTAPVGAIFRSKAAEFQQISNPDLQLPVCPTVLKPFLHRQDASHDDTKLLSQYEPLSFYTSFSIPHTPNGSTHQLSHLELKNSSICLSHTHESTCKHIHITLLPPPPRPRPPSSYLWHPPQPCSPSYSHYGQSCLCRDKLQHRGQRTPSRARWPLLFVHQTLQGPRRQQLTQLGQHCLRTAVIHLRGGGGRETKRVDQLKHSDFIHV